MHIVGTAGHVDHGKSSLVAALTGTNPDRWLEEQVRGMTLDLGFAHLRVGDVEAGIVDVPGHERFLHNMLAGAAGMELLLLVIAANEGVMPQTREHLEMLRFLNVRRCIVVVSKIDLIAAEDRAATIETIRAELRGTLAADEGAVCVSTLDGTGLAELRAAIAASLHALPARAADAPAFLPVDRVFALPGHGTIVTGTLMQGRLRTGDRLQLAPGARAVRVRSLQVFGAARDAVEAGSRVAVNLPGLETADVVRGDVLADAQFASADRYDVEFTPLEASLSLLRRRNPVRVYLGSAEILGTLVLETIPGTAQAVPAAIHLRRAACVYPEENFVVRRMSPKTLLGGGHIRASHAPAGETGEAQGNVVSDVFSAAGLTPLTLSEVAARANVREDVAAEMLERLAEDRRILPVLKPAAYLDGAAAATFLDALTAALIRRQSEQPWVFGATSIALAREFSMPEAVLIRILSALAEDGRIAARSGYYATTDHVPRLLPDQRDFFDRLVSRDPEQPFLPVDLGRVVAELKASRIPGIAQAFDTLLLRGALVKVGSDVYLGKQLAEIHARVEAFLLRERQMTMAQFRDLVGTSRKYAVPLLEWFDARGITVRSGDFRLLRAKRAS